MAGLTDTGLEIPTLDDLNTGLEADMHGNVSPTLNLQSKSALGQYKGSTASQLRQVWEALQALYASWDLRTAVGAELDRLGIIAGVERRPASHSTALLTLVLAAGTYTAGTLIVSKVGDPTIRFSNSGDVVTAGGTVTNVPFEAEDTGAIVAGAGTLSVIANPIIGFTSATNPADAAQGDAVESDSAYRARIQAERALLGSSTVDALRADLLQLKDTDGTPLFSFVGVVENDTDSTDGDGRPPHSFEALVVGGSDQQVGSALLSLKPAGIKAYGTTSVSVLDSQNNSHAIGFSRPAGVPIYFTVGVSYIAGQYQGDSSVKQAIVDWGNANQTVGVDVVHSRIVQIVMEQPGIVDCAVAIGIAPNPVSQTNYAIGPREIAGFDIGRFAFGSTPVGGPP